MEDPRAVSVHSSGAQVLIAFKENVRLYNILRGSLQFFRETVVRNCQHLKYSTGGQFWAAASGLSLMVYDSKSFAQLISFQGHLVPIHEMVWAPGDQAVFSCSTDGNVYGWDVASSNRVNINVASNQTSMITSMAIIADAGLFPVEGRKKPLNFLAFASRDGTIRVMEWKLHDFGMNASSADRPRTPFQRELEKEDPVDYSFPGDGGVTHPTCLVISPDKSFLVVGTNSGDIRLYNWERDPMVSRTTADSTYTEMKAHSGSVVSINVTPAGQIVSVGEDGTVFVWSLEKQDGATDEGRKFIENNLLDEVEPWIFNSGFVCLSNEDVVEHTQTVDSLQKRVREMESKYEYTVRQLENESSQKMRAVMADHIALLNAERSKYEALLATFTDKTREMQRVSESKDIEHMKIIVDVCVPLFLAILKI